MESEFEVSDIETILECIGNNLKNKQSCYLLGGAMMVFSGLKVSTKDIDILFDSDDERKNFINAGKKCGFISLTKDERKDVITLTNPRTGWRLDLFYKTVLGGLKFTKPMKKRSKRLKQYDLLKVNLLSPEDVFLFKTMSDRERDLDDMRLLIGFGIDFHTLSREILDQKEFILKIVPRIEEFKQKYRIDFSLTKKLKKEFAKQQQKWVEDKTEYFVNKWYAEGKSIKEIVNRLSIPEKEVKDILKRKKSRIQNF